MAMYDEKTDPDKPKYKTLECFECEKYCGLYFRPNPTFFDKLFFCSLACYQKNLDKNKKKK